VLLSWLESSLSRFLDGYCSHANRCHDHNGTAGDVREIQHWNLKGRPEWNEWTWTPGIVVPLIITAVLYAGGVLRMMHQPRRVGLRLRQPLFFTIG